MAFVHAQIGHRALDFGPATAYNTVMKLTMVCAVLLFGSIHSLHAARWQAELPGGTYVVETTQIASVSTHEYVVDAGARVFELTIATTSSVIVRFYFIEALAATAYGARGQELLQRVEERATALADRAGQDPVWRKVIKNYPTTTHAHTVEYRLEDHAQIQKLFDSVMSAWKQNKDVTHRVRASQ